MHSKDAGCSDWTWGAGWQIPDPMLSGCCQMVYWTAAPYTCLVHACHPLSVCVWVFFSRGRGVTFTQVTNLKTAGEF